MPKVSHANVDAGTSVTDERQVTNIINQMSRTRVNSKKVKKYALAMSGLISGDSVDKIHTGSSAIDDDNRKNNTINMGIKNSTPGRIILEINVNNDVDSSNTRECGIKNTGDGAWGSNS